MTESELTVACGWCGEQRDFLPIELYGSQGRLAAFECRGCRRWISIKWDAVDGAVREWRIGERLPVMVRFSGPENAVARRER